MRPTVAAWGEDTRQNGKWITFCEEGLDVLAGYRLRQTPGTIFTLPGWWRVGCGLQQPSQMQWPSMCSWSRQLRQTNRRFFGHSYTAPSPKKEFTTAQQAMLLVVTCVSSQESKRQPRATTTTRLMLSLIPLILLAVQTHRYSPSQHHSHSTLRLNYRTSLWPEHKW